MVPLANHRHIGQPLQSTGGDACDAAVRVGELRSHRHVAAVVVQFAGRQNGGRCALKAPLAQLDDVDAQVEHRSAAQFFFPVDKQEVEKFELPYVTL